jgi:hypothetical protein
MEQDRFEVRLRMAAGRAVRFAREYVSQPLPGEALFRVYPNQSYDENPRVGDEVIFPEDQLPPEQFHGPWSVDEVVRFLWRNGKVPEWVNVSVVAEDGRHSIVELRCCGRFTARNELLYHHPPSGIPPFSIKSPILPPGWESPETSGKFDLYWARKRR